jgi:hypothetical protein
VVHFEFLIVRLPWIPGLRNRLLPESVMTVRFVASGELYGFQSTVITHTAKPGLILFLTYPDVVEKIPLREHKRVQCAMPVYFQSRRGACQAIIADLSRGGCRLALDVSGQAELRQTTVGDEIVLRGAFTADGKQQSVICHVRTVDMTPNKMTLGISFTEGEQVFWDSLDAFFVSSLLLD